MSRSAGCWLSLGVVAHARSGRCKYANVRGGGVRAKRAVSSVPQESIQDRLVQKGGVVQDRRDMASDFPLRGFVLCSECRKPYTAAWSRGRKGKDRGRGSNASA